MDVFVKAVFEHVKARNNTNSLQHMERQTPCGFFIAWNDTQNCK